MLSEVLQSTVDLSQVVATNFTLANNGLYSDPKGWISNAVTQNGLLSFTESTTATATATYCEGVRSLVQLFVDIRRDCTADIGFDLVQHESPRRRVSVRPVREWRFQRPCTVYCLERRRSRRCGGVRPGQWYYGSLRREHLRVYLVA